MPDDTDRVRRDVCGSRAAQEPGRPRRARISIARAAPASPAAATPYKVARPTSTPFAPSASALTMSEPRRKPPSIITTASPAASTISGSASIVASEPSSWRPPWFDTTTPSAPWSSASRVSSAVSTPLISIGPPHAFLMKAMSSQFSIGFRRARVNSAMSAAPAPGWQELRDIDDLRHAAAREPDRDQPVRMHQPVQHDRRRERHLVGEAMTRIALPTPRDHGIHGDEQRLVSGRPRAFEHPRAERAVGPRIKLEPLYAGGRGSNVLDRIRRGGRKREACARLRRRRGQRNIRVPPMDAVQSRRRDHERKTEFLPEQRDRKIALGICGEKPRPEAIALKALTVGAECDLVLCTAIHKIEDDARQSSPRERAQIRNIDCRSEIHALAFMERLSPGPRRPSAISPPLSRAASRTRRPAMPPPRIPRRRADREP